MLSNIEENLYRKNSISSKKEIIDFINNCGSYKKTEYDKSNFHIIQAYSYLLYSVYNLKIKEDDKIDFQKRKNDVNIALDYCNKAIKHLKKHKVSENNSFLIYAENLKLWCIYELNEFPSPYDEYYFPEYIFRVSNSDDYYNYGLGYNDKKYNSSVLVQLVEKSKEVMERDKYLNALYYLLTAKNLFKVGYDIGYKEEYYWQYSRITSSLANSFAKLENYEHAVKFSEETIDYLEFLRDKSKNDTISRFMNLLIVHELFLLEKYKKETVKGSNIINLGVNYKNDLTKFKNIIPEIYKYFGKNSYSYVEALNQLIILYGFDVLELLVRKEWKKCKLQHKDFCKYFEEYINSLKHYMYYNSSLLSEKDRFDIMNNSSFVIEYLMGYTNLFKNRNEESFYNTLLFYKGLLLRSKVEFNKILPKNKSLSDADSIVYAMQGNFMNFVNDNWKDIANNLDEQSVAIEFWHFPTLNDKIDCYCASIIRKNYKKPKFVLLSNSDELSFKGKLNTFDLMDLYDLVWKELEPHLNHNDNVYFSPIGILHNICIESAIDSLGVRASDKWNLYRVSSTREVLNINHKRETHKSVILYGWINYNLKNIDDPYLISDNESSQARNYLMGRSYSSLPYTKLEIDEISNLLHEKSMKYKCYSKDFASEESFKNLSGKKNSIIHIATHGFYWKSPNQYRDVLRMDGNYDSFKANYEKSMIHSGLIFSGVNKNLKETNINNDFNDGILTAHEISKLDLSGCDLVVLSACKTGIGDLSTSEGVFGLQRGFKLAGVNSIIMSLWNVDDSATKILMSEFYRNYLAGSSKLESLKQAQKTVESYPEYKHPKYWAGFILLDATN